MPDHSHFQDEIPAFVASRLEAEDRRRLEAHLGECEICSEMAATCREVVSALREGGETLFEDHPEEMTLRRYASGERIPEVRSVAHHLASCPSCELEVSAWKAREAGAQPAQGAATGAPEGVGPRRSVPLVIPAAAAVVGLLVGAGLTLLVHQPPPASPPSGPVPLIVLSSPLRGVETVPSLSVPAGAPSVFIAVQLDLPESTSARESYRFSIYDAAGRQAWSTLMTSESIAGHLESAGVVSLAVPSTDLPPGGYEISVQRQGDPIDRPMLLIPFTTSP